MSLIVPLDRHYLRVFDHVSVVENKVPGGIVWQSSVEARFAEDIFGSNGRFIIYSMSFLGIPICV